MSKETAFYPRLAALDIWKKGGKVRAENEDAVAWVQERFAKELLEDLGPRAHDDVLRVCGDPELIAHEFGRLFAKGRQARRRAVMRLIVANRLFAGGLGRSRALKGTVANLQFNDVLSLAL